MKKLLCAVLFLYSLSSSAIDLIDLKRRGYAVDQFDISYNLDEVLSEIQSQSQYLFQKPEEFKKTFFEWNPHLRGLSSLAGQYYYRKYPFSTHLGYQWAPSLKQDELKAVASVCFDEFSASLGERVSCPSIGNRAPASTSQARIKPKTKSQFLNFLHVTVSQGQFNDTIGSSEISSQQNSPFTIGAGLVYLPESAPNYSIASSIYYSNLTASNIDDPSGVVTNTDIKVPAEIGLNVYGQRNVNVGIINAFYGGLDYEEFNVYTFDKFLEGATTELDVERQKVIYATAGMGMKMDFKNPISLKVSGSLSVSNSTDLSGFKYMFYFNQKITKQFWYHLLYKQHILSNNFREVAISRYGIGVGMGF